MYLLKKCKIDNKYVRNRQRNMAKDKGLDNAQSTLHWEKQTQQTMDNAK